MGFLRQTFPFRYALVLLLTVSFLSSCRQLEKLIAGEESSNSAPVHSDEPFKLLIAGQSNGVSNGHGITASSSDGSVETTRIFSHTDDRFQQWVPSESEPDKFNITWIYLGNSIKNTHGRDVKIYNFARGNTSTRNMIQYVPSLVEAVRRYKPDMVLWVQGESDKIEKIPFHESYEHMTYIIGQTRSVDPDLRWVVALNGFVPEPHSREQSPVRMTQRKLISQGLVYEGPDMDKMRYEHRNYFEPTSHNIGWGAELVGPGFAAFAEAWYKVIFTPYLP